MSFNGKVVVVTGASSGIGAATAKLFASEGAQVVINGRNEKKLAAVTSEVAKLGKAPLVINADVSKDNDAIKLVNETIAKFGKIDVFVNNAGFSRQGSVLDGKLLQSYDEIMPTNVRAVVHLTSLVAPHLIKTKGNIINISSVAGTVPPRMPTANIYTVSKAALNHFTRGAALELAEHGVRVNTVSPGPTVTNFTANANVNINIEDFAPNMALKRVSQPSEMADVILFLASDKAVGITGSNFVADCGAAALELAEHGVRANTVSPGVTVTDFIANANINMKIEDLAPTMPLKRVSQPSEMADVILYLASDKAVGITGSEFVADCGFLLNN